MTDLSSIPLSVLELAEIPSGGTPEQALRATLEVAKLVDRLGYHRIWLAEHHNMSGIASSAPVITIGQVAAHTERIRVGSGGVLLTNHAPLVVAEQFGTLAAFHPGRIDLGIGRAPGADATTSRALHRPPEAASPVFFPRQFDELLALLSEKAQDQQSLAGITAIPGRGCKVPVWLLGSSDISARVAGQRGLPFAFAGHFDASKIEPALDVYRSTFRPSEALAEPCAMVCVSVVCAEDGEQAHRLTAPSALVQLRLRRGGTATFPHPDEAAAFPWSQEDRALVEPWTRSQVVGTPDHVRDELAALVHRSGADELMVTTMTYDLADRLRSFELLAGALQLSGNPLSTTAN
ncbi:LLM class flavin-dependent oxidoreductase [Nocardia sp. NPDC051570]|uniref:LLM class flavin-dependent oxidoreductase n=1 Tax=Nocardia sp. NPDC051570 TaxID=3364324 RepID=UPI00379B13BF